MWSSSAPRSVGVAAEGTAILPVPPLAPDGGCGEGDVNQSGPCPGGGHYDSGVDLFEYLSARSDREERLRAETERQREENDAFVTGYLLGMPF